MKELVTPSLSPIPYTFSPIDDAYPLSSMPNVRDCDDE